jgi:Rieske Fe-S protein
MSSVCRRTVLKGAAATCGVGLLAACGGEDDAAPAASGGGNGVRAALVRLDEVPVGEAVEATDADGGKVLVARLSESEVVAFSAVCPHQGCTVAPDGEQLACPCHGSQFELDGSLKRGPAEKGLTPYEIEVVDGQVLPA